MVKATLLHAGKATNVLIHFTLCRWTSSRSKCWFSPSKQWYGWTGVRHIYYQTQTASEQPLSDWCKGNYHLWSEWTNWHTTYIQHGTHTCTHKREEGVRRRKVSIALIDLHLFTIPSYNHHFYSVYLSKDHGLYSPNISCCAAKVLKQVLRRWGQPIIFYMKVHE